MSFALFIIAFGIGIAFGLTFAWFTRTREFRALTAQLAAEQERSVSLQRDLISKAEDVAAIREGLARADAELEAERRSAAEKIATLEQAEARLRDTFEALSAQALRQNSDSFLQLAKENLSNFTSAAANDLEQRQTAIETLVQPLTQQLERLDAKVIDIERARQEAYGALREQVAQLQSTGAGLVAETQKLVKALRSPNVRGRWGEIQLRRVVELAGLLSYCDFREQQTVDTDDGALRPDVVVQLPGGRSLVVDAKVPLTSYLDAIELNDDDARSERLRDHARQVRDHITKLSNKQYWSQLQPSPEFVVMFLPAEPFFSSALEQDPALIEYGVQHGVIPASPTTLISLLRAVAYGWRQELIAQNAVEISNLGRELHDRLATMVEHLDLLRKRIDSAVDAYNRLVGSFETRVMVGARRFKELGVTTTKDLHSTQLVTRSARGLVIGPGDGSTDVDATGDAASTT